MIHIDVRDRTGVSYTLTMRLLDTCIMQTMLPQAMVVYEVSWYLTWVLSSAETHGACV